ncbi:MAG TPA: hypothetical protein VEU62_11955 [Bryobacterales bacterium]|nr:hypothetical protein [Bryobacterales bacterium]
MFARKLRLELAEGEARRPVPKDWLDDFFMRNFIGLSAFDEVLVTGEGRMETSLAVEPEQVQEHFEKWLRGRKLIGEGARIEVRLRAVSEHASK